MKNTDYILATLFYLMLHRLQGFDLECNISSFILKDLTLQL
jgi:hypothetical protein